MQSSLFFSLAQASRLAGELRDGPCGVPRCGAVLSPGIEVFRKGITQGFAPRQSVELAAVLSVALPPATSSSFEDLMQATYESALRGAGKVSARIFVVPDTGGATSTRLGTALGRALARCSGSVTKVVIVGGDDMYQTTRQAFTAACSGAPVNRAPAAASLSTRPGRPEPLPGGNAPPPNGLSGSLGGDFRPQARRRNAGFDGAEPWRHGSRQLGSATSNRSLLFG